MSTARPSSALPDRAPPLVMLAMFLVAMTVLILQIAITRVLSVTVSYHSAFVVIALVMLGLAASAISAYLRITRKTPPEGRAAVATAACWAGGITAAAVLVYVHIVAAGGFARSQNFQTLLAAIVFYAAFYQCGYVVAALLTHFARDVSRLYWSDLCGAALGCLIVVPLLGSMSALNVALLSAALLGVAGLLLAISLGTPRLRMLAGGVTIALSSLWGIALVVPPVSQLRVAKDQDQRAVLWERWNSLARVSVTKDIPDTKAIEEYYASIEGISPENVTRLMKLWPVGWGISLNYDQAVPETRWLQLDTAAGTQIIKDAAKLDPQQLEFLKWDVTALGYEIKTPKVERVFIVGGGGGRDMVTAAIYNATHVDVVELNPAVVAAVQDEFGEFSGRPYSLANVDLTIGEARHRLSETDARYDLIQMSMIDTWASSMAGALVLSENTLYTQEAFDLFASRLAPDGLLSVSRWYAPQHPAECMRVVALMGAALRTLGVARPQDHLMIVYNPRGKDGVSVATCLMKRSPFTTAEREKLYGACQKMGFATIWPVAKRDAMKTGIDVLKVIDGDPQTLSTRELDMTPPTDDRPFFFNTKQPIGSWLVAWETQQPDRGSPSTVLLGSVLALLLVAAILVLWIPLRMGSTSAASDAPSSAGLPWGPICYFAGIGCGFMFIELALIQRYIVFLGHPTYAISVVLFALLLFSGIGSSLTDWIRRNVAIGARTAVTGVFGLTLVTAFHVPGWLLAAHGWSEPARMTLAVLLIAPSGIAMGMLYPLGVRRLEAGGQSDRVPWMWGVNGIAGVLASVIGMMIAMSYGYTTLLLAAIPAYGLTLLSTWIGGWGSLADLPPVKQTAADREGGGGAARSTDAITTA